MILSSGKASEKTVCSFVAEAHTYRVLCVIHEREAFICVSAYEERIAELEAELAARTVWANKAEKFAKQHGVPVEDWKALEARAEKAEAEVERLSLLAKKATPKTCPPHDYGSAVCRICGAARKERDEGCGGTTHTVVHADGEVCPFLVPRSPPLRYANPNGNETKEV